MTDGMFVDAPEIYVIGRQQIDEAERLRFLDDEDTYWDRWQDENFVPDSLRIAEMGGRICYMAFGDHAYTKTNAKYIRNLIDQDHQSVLEHAVWTLIVTGVSRSLTHELIRHRVGIAYCLAGDTLIYSDHFANGRREGVTKRRLDDIYAMTKTPHGRSRLKLLRLRCLDETTGMFSRGAIRSVIASGKKSVFRVELADGKTITSTKEHRFLTRNGWLSLEEAVGGIEVVDGVARVGHLRAEIATNGVLAYKDAAWLREQYVEKNMDQETIAKLAGVSQHTIRAWVCKHGLQKPLGSWSKGKTPSNKGKTYTLRPWTQSARDTHSERLRGENNHRWRGGITRKSSAVRSGLNRLKRIVIARDGRTCRMCGGDGASEMHHVLPVWARPDLVRDPLNIVLLHSECHSATQGHEERYVELFGRSLDEMGDAIRPSGKKRSVIRKWTAITSVAYAGEQETYDIEMDGAHHNFVANGIVVHNSQLSQRYVDERDARFVIPPDYFNQPDLLQWWMDLMNTALKNYEDFVDIKAKELAEQYPTMTKRELRIRTRQAARSILPNATETKIQLTINGRTLRHIIRMRGSLFAEAEIRRFAVALLRLMQREAPTLVSDFTIMGSVEEGEYVHFTGRGN